MAVERLPLFPLHTVLFPGGPLALRIFEARYLDLVRGCMRDGGSFGVVLILAGAEAGAAAAVADVGTSARLVDFDTLPDGLLGVTCQGERRFRVHSRWQQADGLNVAEVAYLPEDAPCALPASAAHLARLLRQVLPQLGTAYASAAVRFEDAGWVANRCAEILPLSLAQRLELLQLDEPAVRLERVAAWSQR
jgi:Lon protease-like protein